MITPLKDRILVLPKKPEAVSIGGVHIPEVAQEKPQTATVIATGSNVYDITDGAVVLYSKYGGTEVSIDGEDLLLLRQDDVIGTLS